MHPVTTYEILQAWVGKRGFKYCVEVIVFGLGAAQLLYADCEDSRSAVYWRLVSFRERPPSVVLYPVVLKIERIGR